MAGVQPASAAPLQGAHACESLNASSLLPGDPTARIDKAIWHDKSETMQTPVGPGMTVPVEVASHCEITGSLQHRTGLYGQAYAIRFHLRLPAKWNGRFVFQGGGGSNGELGDALGHVRPDGPVALSDGYAVVSQDSGHDNATNTDLAHNGQVAFGFDPQARANYGHTSLKLVADTAKVLIEDYYGRAPRYSYFVGCSKGGQEGMTFAQLYPEEFDGIIAAAPGFSLPRAALAEAWDVQAMAALIKAPDATSFDIARLREAFSADDLGLVRTSVLDACDSDDGLKDGIVGDFYHCSDAKVMAQLNARTCKGAKQSDCLMPAQITALTRVVHGPVNSAGRSLYAGWFWPSGIAGEDWRMWKIGSSDGRIPALNVVLGGASLAAVFTTPPTAISGGPQDFADYQMRFDFDRDAAGIYAVASPFKTSAWHDVGSRSPDLAGFRARGGRLIVPHGESDPVFSLKDTLNWYDEINAATEGHASDFVRVFPVPGMCHCGGGEATDTYDAFAALVSWVETRKAPDSLLAVAGARSPWPGRQRPLCAYPNVARYKGGDPEHAGSFVCVL